MFSKDEISNQTTTTNTAISTDLKKMVKGYFGPLDHGEVKGVFGHYIKKHEHSLFDFLVIFFALLGIQTERAARRDFLLNLKSMTTHYLNHPSLQTYEQLQGCLEVGLLEFKCPISQTTDPSHFEQSLHAKLLTFKHEFEQLAPNRGIPRTMH